MFTFLIIQACLLSAQTIQAQAVGLDGGYYRCQWFQRPDVTDANKPEIGNTMVPGVTSTISQCLMQDSEKMTSFVNHCTGESYVPLDVCNENGTWNCHSFISLCKTLIRTSYPQRTQQQKMVGDSTARPCTPDPTRRFTLEAMGVAILVSFISGISILGIVIIVVWKYKNSTTALEVHTNQESFRKHSERISALKSLATLLGTKSNTLSSGVVINPNYDQAITCTPASVVDDILMENERLYEEIILRRKSSCSQHSTIGECLYSKVNKIKQEKAAQNSKLCSEPLSKGVQEAIPEENSDVSEIADELSSGVCSLANRKADQNTGENMQNERKASNVYETCFSDSHRIVNERKLNEQTKQENCDSGVYDMVR